MENEISFSGPPTFPSFFQENNPQTRAIRRGEPQSNLGSVRKIIFSRAKHNDPVACFLLYTALTDYSYPNKSLFQVLEQPDYLHRHW